MQVKRVYVATPYAALRCRDGDRADLAKRIAVCECKLLRLLGYEPLSPILWLDGKYDEDTRRDEVLAAGLRLLENCDYFYESKHKDAKRSQGIKLEREFAEANGIPQLKIDKKFNVSICV